MFTIDGLGREDPQQHVRFVQMWLNDDQVGHLAHVAAGKTALADDVAWRIVGYRHSWRGDAVANRYSIPDSTDGQAYPDRLCHLLI